MRRELEAEGLRRQHEHSRDVTIAWMVAGLSRQERLPKLETLLHGAGKPKGQTRAEMLKVAQQLADGYGYKLRTVVH